MTIWRSILRWVKSFPRYPLLGRYMESCAQALSWCLTLCRTEQVSNSYGFAPADSEFKNDHASASSHKSKPLLKRVLLQCSLRCQSGMFLAQDDFGMRTLISCHSYSHDSSRTKGYPCMY